MKRPIRTAFAVCATLALVAVWFVAAPMHLGGHSAYVTTHGTSMEPRFHTGDLAVLRPAEHYRVGDVVAYHSAQLATVVMHRVVAVDGGRYTFQGDNNDFLDPDHPRSADLIGTLAFRVPQGGIWLDRVTSPVALGLITFALLAGGGAATQRQHRRKRRTVSGHAQRSARQLPSMTALPSALRTAAGVTAVVGVLGLTLGVVAWTRPVTQSGTGQHATADPSAGQHDAQSMVFSYSATVPRTVAYDDTTVTAPDPVFRTLANEVRVEFAYQGPPGTVSVAAELSAANGWHSTVPLAPATPFTGDRYDGTVNLDLAGLDARAQAAAVVIGIPVSQLSLAVTPTVVTEDGASFEPALPLALASAQLTLPGGDKSLTVGDTPRSAPTKAVAQTFGVAGREITVATARWLSAILVLVGLVGGLVLAVMGWRLSAATESARIHRRYAPLLVPVHPMAAPAGRPVIDVTEFATLARLAERYGLLVLHWSRSEVETFVVQDESTTYRYRTGTDGETVTEDIASDVRAG